MQSKPLDADVKVTPQNLTLSLRPGNFNPQNSIVWGQSRKYLHSSQGFFEVLTWRRSLKQKSLIAVLTKTRISRRIWEGWEEEGGCSIQKTFSGRGPMDKCFFFLLE